MAQFARPDNDDSIGSWTDESSGTTDIYTGIDEVSAEDNRQRIDTHMFPQASIGNFWNHFVPL